MRTKILTKVIIAVSFFIITFSGCNNKEKGYTINGSLNYANNIDSVFIYQYSADGNQKKLSVAPVIDNKFTITGFVDAPQKALIGNINKNFGGEIILENADYKLTTDGKFFNITGSEIHEKILGFVNKPEYQKITTDYNTESEKLFKGIDMNDEKALKEARRLDEELSKKVMDYEDQIFEKIINDKNEKTVVKLLALVTTQNWKTYNKEKRLELLSEYEKELGNHINIKTEREFLAKDDKTTSMAESVKNGSMFKEVVAKDVTGKVISLSELVKNNEYTLLEFWASWCSPCRAEIPNLKKAYKKYKDAGLEIYSVSIDSKRDEWELALKEEKATWPNSLIVGDEQTQVSAYGVQGIPASYLIAKDGTIVASNEELREFDLDRTLSKFFKK